MTSIPKLKALLNSNLDPVIAEKLKSKSKSKSMSVSTSTPNSKFEPSIEDLNFVIELERWGQGLGWPSSSNETMERWNRLRNEYNSAACLQPLKNNKE